MRKNLFLFLTAASLVTLASVQTALAQNGAPYWSTFGNSNATSSSKLGTTNGINLRLYTNNAERVRILYNNGFVGINTTAPNARLHFNTQAGTSLLRGTVDGSTKLYMSSKGGLTVGAGLEAPANGLYVAGSVGIGTNTPAYKLQVVGNSSFSGQLTVGNGGVYGYNSSGPGVYASGSSYGVYATSSGTYGVYSSGATYGVYGKGTYGLYGISTSTSGYGTVSYGGYGGVYGSGTTLGVYGTGGSYGVWGYNGSSIGVYGQSASNVGVYAYSNTYRGLEAHNNSGNWAITSYGGYGGTYGTGNTYGVYGTTTGTTGIGGYFYSTNYYGLRAGTGRTDKNWAAVFDGNIYTFGAYQPSDRNLKKDIADFSDAMSLINKLKPRSYEYRSDGKLAAMNLPKGKQFGFIAQELQEVFPNLVKEMDGAIADVSKAEPKPTTLTNIASAPLDPKAPIAQSIQKETEATDQSASGEKMTVSSINYTGLIPIMIKGMQEQAELIKQQQLQIDDLKAQVSRITGGGGTLTGMGSLGQNTPNPVSTSTRIAYSVPSGVNHAQLLVTDNGGKTIKAVSLSPGSNAVNFNTMGLSSGIYNYSLMIDGKIVETKKMEVVRNR